MQFKYLARIKKLSFHYLDIFENIMGRIRPYLLLEAVFLKNRAESLLIYFRIKNIVLELPANFGTNMVSNFIISFIILMTYTKKHAAKPKRKINSEPCFIVDEASTLMQSNRDDQDSFIYEPTLNEIIRKSREFGIGLWLCSQEAEKL